MQCRVARPEYEETHELTGYGWQVNWDPMTFGKKGEWDELSDDDPSPWEVHLWRVVEGAVGPFPPWEWNEWQEDIAYEPPPKPRVPESPHEYEANEQVQQQRMRRTNEWLSGADTQESKEKIIPLNTDEDARLFPVWDYHHMDQHWTHQELVDLVYQASPEFDLERLIDEGAISVQDPSSSYDYWRLPDIQTETIEDGIERLGMWLEPEEDDVVTPPRETLDMPIEGTTTYWIERNAMEEIPKEPDYYIDPMPALDTKLTAAVSPAEFREQGNSLQYKADLAYQYKTATGIFEDKRSQHVPHNTLHSLVVPTSPRVTRQQSRSEHGVTSTPSSESGSEFEAEDLLSLAEDTSIDESNFDDT